MRDGFQAFDRHADANLGAFAMLATQGQLPPHHAAQGSADDQAQPRAAPGQLAVGFCLGEWFEQTLLIGGTDANAAVLDPQVEHCPARLFFWLQLQVQANLSVLGEFYRVADQVRQYLLEAQGVDQYGLVGARVQCKDQAQLLLPGQSVEHPRH
ncbi:hypothetical protein D3C85_783050 [compost metagenome]